MNLFRKSVESSDKEDKDASEDKKSKKKKKKHKKKKKKHKRSDDHSDEEEKPSKKVKTESDSFWGGDKPFEISDSKVSNGHGEVKRERDRGEQGYSEKNGRYDKYEKYDKYERGEYHREKDIKPKIEYDDERRPVDLGREARPYPTGGSRETSSYRSARYTIIIVPCTFLYAMHDIWQVRESLQRGVL